MVLLLNINFLLVNLHCYHASHPVSAFPWFKRHFLLVSISVLSWLKEKTLNPGNKITKQRHVSWLKANKHPGKEKRKASSQHVQVLLGEKLDAFSPKKVAIIHQDNCLEQP